MFLSFFEGKYIIFKLQTLIYCCTLLFAFFLLEHAEKPLLRGNVELQRIMNKIRDYLGPFPDIEPLPDGSTPNVRYKLVRFLENTQK